MLQFPLIPPWESLHPLVVHFPIVLLLLSPVFILVSAILPRSKGRPYLIAALAILVTGTIGLFIADATGEAAAKRVQRNDAVNAILSTHEQLASQTAIVFSGLVVILLVIVLLPHVLRCQETRLITTLLPVSFLVLYCAGILFLINTAHAGGRLVHEFGGHATVSAEKGLSGNPPPAQISEKGDRP